MEQLTTIAEQRAWTATARQAGERIGCVPTMGALHEGHLSLIRLAQADCDRVVVTIFVNPTQFDDPSDLDSYPTSMANDMDMLEALGVDAVFTPAVAEIYPEGYASFVEVVGQLTESLCGVTRPGHFRGVATVVAKLFNIIQPDAAWFGEKDLQQVLVINRMVSDLAMPVAINVGPTVREADGLAMSSRNRRLDDESREIAAGLPRGLELANLAYEAGERSSLKLIELVAEELLVYDGVDLDYATVIKVAGFEEVETAEDGCFLAVAVIIRGVRLIDHVHLGREHLPVAV